MQDLKLEAILPLFLFFLLVVGIVVIYREEIEKMELFGKLHTTPVPGTVTNKPSIPPSILDSSSVDSLLGQAITPFAEASLFGGSHPVRFGSGRLVDSDLRDIGETLQIGSEALHTISPEVNDYYARAFTEETTRLYQPSPYSGSVVFLDRVSNIKESDPNREYFVLLVSNALAKPIIITDWRVFDRQGKISYNFPKGIKVLGSSHEVFEPIIVQPGHAIVVSSGRSPISNSFRVNKCSGYRSQFKKFTPGIKTSCPEPMREFLEYESIPFSDNECYEAVTSLSACTTVVVIPPGITKQCKDFLGSVMTETGCVARHRNDPDFFAPEWRIFLNSERELWKNRDNVLYLLDENGLLVATMVYQ